MSRRVLISPEMRAAAPELLDALEPVYIAETEAEREAVFAFRYSVYVAELGRRLGSADHNRKRVHDEQDDERYTMLLYTDDGAGNVTGTVRIMAWEPGQVPERAWEAFSMERFNGIRELRTGELGRLMIEPGRRGRLGLASIACAIYQLYSAYDVGFLNCATGLVRHYRLFGFRPYAGRMVATVDGIEVPLLLLPGDRAFLEHAGSFLAPFVDVFFGPGKRTPVDVGRWAHLLDAESAPVKFDPATVWERIDGFRNGGAGPPSMLETMSEDAVRRLAEKGFLMDVPGGYLLTEKGLAQQEIFVILDGVFEVFDGDRRLGVIGRGDVVGEVGFFGSSGRRIASVTAASDGQVLVLRRHFVHELMKSDPSAAAEVLFALARVLADRQYI